MSTDNPWERIHDAMGTAERLAWFRRMHDVYEHLPEAEKQALHAWEQTHLDGHRVGTADWPGWRKYKYLGPPPATTERT